MRYMCLLSNILLYLLGDLFLSFGIILFLVSIHFPSLFYIRESIYSDYNKSNKFMLLFFYSIIFCVPLIMAYIIAYFYFKKTL